jgi:hypothetical protein
MNKSYLLLICCFFVGGFVQLSNGIADQFLDKQKRDIISNILNRYTHFEGLPVSLDEIKAFPITDDVCKMIQRDTDWMEVVCENGCESSDIQALAECFKEKLDLAYGTMFSQIQDNQTISDELKHYKIIVTSISYLIQYYSIMNLKNKISFS